ncbi:hypothetical protein BDR04DRAFT_1097592 [Suillus decipiens]|nr:hypothetical protein BDR04DRAFT_1097592 [Suillus decipiens]
MCSKALALFAIFAVIAPALTAPLPGAGEVVGVFADVENDVEKLHLNVASTAPKAKRAEVGDVVVVTLDSVAYTALSQADGSWSTTINPVNINALPDTDLIH